MISILMMLSVSTGCINLNGTLRCLSAKRCAEHAAPPEALRREPGAIPEQINKQGD
jgi:hypothetical protein